MRRKQKRPTETISIQVTRIDKERMRSAARRQYLALATWVRQRALEALDSPPGTLG